MKTYLIKEGIRGLFSVDENNNLDLQDYDSSRINWMYRVEHDGTLTYRKKDGSEKTFDVKKGDMVIEFYSGYNYPNQCIVIRNDQWNENIEAYRAAALKRAEEDKKNAQKITPNCENCENCALAGM